MRGITVNVMKWAEHAKPGERVTYYSSHGCIGENPTQQAALQASERGLVFLAQRRQPGGVFSYEATRIDNATAKRIERISRSVEQSLATMKRGVL